ncbi:hypothetical protein, conserved [Eimeria tenella]|uniref:Uncharacterized protein n=1 Tax=Eimeria tenella TaxID=5802 RepID=U6KNE4_EIMTE|nr:hypothetical protein, conserved [Eimeria tenella]CDJ36968.1 hypothetical protein, conserved [Eimeria tenella]|eukprot:XP_013227806.1 hypothetical protein, conserved [Eimeria tenella]
MVTTRQRRGAVALPVPENRQNFNASTAGPFTLNKTDPKVSVSGARIDRLGLHVSLTIPLESSVTPQGAKKSSAIARRGNNKPALSPRNRAFPLQGAISSRTTTGSPNAENTGNTSPQRASKKVKQAAATSVRQNRPRRIRRLSPTLPTILTSDDNHSRKFRLSKETAPLNLPVVTETQNGPTNISATTSESHETSSGIGVDVPLSSLQQRRGRSRGTESSDTSVVRFTAGLQNPETSDNGDDHQILLSPAQMFFPEAMTGRKVSMPARGQPRFWSLQRLRQTLCPGRRESTDASSFIVYRKREAHTLTWKSLCFLYHEFLMRYFGIRKLIGWLVRKFREHPPAQRSRKPLRWAVPAFVAASCACYLVWQRSHNAATWSNFAEISAPLDSPGNSSTAVRGRFYLVHPCKAHPQCALLGYTCDESREELCGIGLDSALKECQALGEDVAARNAGGFIDYARTSGGVSQAALVLSELLQAVASFAMPNMRSDTFTAHSPLSAAPEFEDTRLLRSYFPLYNYKNDPGRLVYDSNATYLLTEKHGQIAVSLGRRALIFAIAIETTATASPHCDPVEMHWFSIYVRLEGQTEDACPRLLSSKEIFPTWGTKEAEKLCRVGSFEYRCARTQAVQVFCLDKPPGELQNTEDQIVGNGDAFCDGAGWVTQRVYVVLKDNWGAEATRIRRLRVLASLQKP